MAKTDRDKLLDRAERAIDDAFTTGKADRAYITRMAQLDAAEAVARAGEAMEADEEADEAIRHRNGNRGPSGSRGSRHSHA